MPPNLWRWLVPPLTAAFVWLCPHAGFDARTWGLLTVFAATIAGLIAQPLPAGAVVVIGVTIANVLGIVTIQEALSGFANVTVCLIVAAFVFATGFRKLSPLLNHECDTPHHSCFNATNGSTFAARRAGR
ncbi:MAG: anion permease [Blastocatellia bacterium]